MSDLIRAYRAIQDAIKTKEAEIASLLMQAKTLKEAMPRIYYVKGNGIKEHSPMPEGIHFAARSSAECMAWLNDNYPMMEIFQEEFCRDFGRSQFGCNMRYYHDHVDGDIGYVIPIDEEWHKAVAILKV